MQKQLTILRTRPEMHVDTLHAQKYIRVDMQTRLLRMIKYKEPDPFQVQKILPADN